MLTPDDKGSYVNGTWKTIASLPSGYVPLYFAGAVLADGRVVIIGGEYLDNNFYLTNMGAIYDPAADTWTKLGHPKGWGFIGDSPCAVLPDGRLLLGRKLDKRIAAMDPKTLQWTELGDTGKRDFNAEEGWTLLPDGSVLTYDVKDAPHSERYISSEQKWVSAGSTIVDLHAPYQGSCLPYDNGKKCYHPPGEVGPGMLRPDGTVFATGAYSTSGAGHTAIYVLPPTSGRLAPTFPMATPPAIPLPCSCPTETYWCWAIRLALRVGWGEADDRPGGGRVAPIQAAQWPGDCRWQ